MISFECVKEITKKLKENFPNIQANSYGYDEINYDKFHKEKNNKDFVKTMLFKGGYDPHFNEITQKFCTGESVELWYNCTEYKLEDVISIIKEIVSKYNYILDFENKNKGSMYICENKDAVARVHLPF